MNQIKSSIDIKIKTLIAVISLAIMAAFSLISCASSKKTVNSIRYKKIYSIGIDEDKTNAYHKALNLLAAQYGGYKFALSKDVFAAKANKVKFNRSYNIYYKPLPDGKILCVMNTSMPGKINYRRRYYSLTKKIPIMAFFDDRLREKMFSTLLGILFKKHASPDNFIKGYIYITYLPNLKKYKKIPESIYMRLTALK